MSGVFRCYSEKKSGFDIEARAVLDEIRTNLMISSLDSVRIFCRYDVEGIDEGTYVLSRENVFSEPMCDNCYDEEMPDIPKGSRVLAVEPLPGQFDQRSDSCAQCIQLLTQKPRPVVHAAKIYVLSGDISDDEFFSIRNFLINPIEAREASLEKPETLIQKYDMPTSVDTVAGLISMDDKDLGEILSKYALAMDEDDLVFLRDYFRDEEKRDPTITEMRMIDTYWSDHCRHTTFSTHIDDVKIDDPVISRAFDEYIKTRKEIYEGRADSRPVTLMDVATLAVKTLKKRGVLKNLDESEEINACSVKVKANIDGEDADWLLMFKNETHNHPTEIEPFGGAATCLGGAIRDPLSGRSYVYQAMRVTGAADPTVPISDTLPGKLPQRKICQTAAAGYSSYGNQIGLSTGLVREIYHPGYVAKRLEIGAVVGAAPECNVVREAPVPGDVVILLGGRTGRDGCGGATGSSKSHTGESLAQCGAEVQKGNAPEERKIQRLFRNHEVTRLIKRSNDFGAGGVSVAVGELADGLLIDLDKVPKKYDGLDGTELAISESQERMAVVISSENTDKFLAFCADENIEANIIAKVTDNKRLRMTWNGRVIVDISREFLNSSGAEKHVRAEIAPLPKIRHDDAAYSGKSRAEKLKNCLSDLNVSLERGLIERFDGSIGAGSVIMPFGGKYQLSPSQVMAAKFPVLDGETTTASVMAFGFDPYLSEKNPFIGASCAVIESIAKLVSAGCDYKKAYLSLQEYFEKLGRDPKRFGKPLSALLGAFSAQIALSVAAIGGKDSMSGSFNELDVPPTLVSFAIAPCDTSDIITTEFKKPGSALLFFKASYKESGEPDYAAIKNTWDNVRALADSGKILSAFPVSTGGIAEAVCKMAVGGDIGAEISRNVTDEMLFSRNYGGIVVECDDDRFDGAVLIGRTTKTPEISFGDETISLNDVRIALESRLEGVYPTAAKAGEHDVSQITSDRAPVLIKGGSFGKPRVVIPVFPGTNCEYDTARAVKAAGGEPRIILVRNLTPSLLEESSSALRSAIEESQIIIIPGGFSGGDEPDGSGKFIASFFKSPTIKDAVHDLLKNRDGLMLGICNGFQALIKLGLVPFGEIRDMDDGCPTLTYNTIGRHQSLYARTRVSSVISPWLSQCSLGDMHVVPMSHGEGRFVASDETIAKLIENGQVAFQYVDESGKPSMSIDVNPNGSMFAIEGITSPDGRVLGKMGHTERYAPDIAQNIYGNKYQPLFRGGMDYFR